MEHITIMTKSSETPVQDRLSGWQRLAHSRGRLSWDWSAREGTLSAANLATTAL